MIRELFICTLELCDANASNGGEHIQLAVELTLEAVTYSCTLSVEAMHVHCVALPQQMEGRTDGIQLYI